MIYSLNIKQIDLLNYKNIKTFYNFKHILKFDQFKYILYKFIYSFFFFINVYKKLLEIKKILSFFQLQSQKYEHTFWSFPFFINFTLFASTNSAEQVINLIKFINNQKYFFLSFIKLNKNFCKFNFMLNIIKITNILSYKNILYNLLFLLLSLKFRLINFQNLITLLCQH